MKDIQAVLFSGGKGKRLFPITDYYQKVMMPLGEKGIPVLEYIIKHLSHHGVKKFVALLGYKSNQVRRYFGDGSEFDVEIEYIKDSENMKGTGAALLNAKDVLTEKHLIIYYTDILSNVNIKNLYNFHKTHNKVGSIWVDPSWKVPEGVINSDADGTVLSLEYNPKQIIVSTGISILSSRVFEYLGEFIPDKKNKLEIDLSRNIYPRLVKEEQIAAYPSDEWWIDLGSLYKYKSIDENLILNKFSHFINTR